MAKIKKPVPQVRRAALYIRVSTEEQAIHGLSIDAQTTALRNWARENRYKVVGFYTDAGISARKPASKRPELQRLLNDVRGGNVDLIVFTKLDRWFRNVAEYHKVQEVLEQYNVAWQAIQEDYETATSSGRFKVNIMLSVAETEADRTSERIKVVFDNKVTKGEAITGSMPLGLKIQNKRIVRDPETAPIVETLFQHYRDHGSAGDARRYIYTAYNVILYEHTVRRMLSNPMYKGTYRNNPDYCEAIIPPDEFDSIQQMLENRSIRSNQSGRIYIFSGLLVCQECGKMISGHYCKSGYNSNEYYLYRCRNAVLYHKCSHHKCVNEEKLEQWLLLNVSSELEHWQTTWEIEVARAPKPKVDRAAIRRKLDKLKDLYINDLITMEQYKEDYTKYNLLLQQEPKESQPAPDFQALRQLVSGDFQTIYSTFDRPQRRDIWRSIVQKIYLDGDNKPRLVFRQ